jgi:hypothetical protein
VGSDWLARGRHRYAHARIAENRSQPFSPVRPFVSPNLKLRRALISVSLTTAPDALDRDDLAE